ncbi:MAG: glycosyltransferase family 39 protein [Deltaproteobacteria bacterium]|nr:glycosyltransferase family 39 protein [Deltaproteobacteria bacterium]
MKPTEQLSWARFALVVLGIAAAGVGQWFIREQSYVTQATIALVVGALTAALVMGPPQPLAIPAVSLQPTPTSRYRVVVGLLVSLLGIGVFGYACYGLFFRWTAAFDYLAPLTVAAVAVWSVGLAILDRRWRLSSESAPWTAWEIAVLLLVVGLAFFMRFYKYDYFPPHDGFYAIEEPQSGMGAWEILALKSRPWEFLLDRWLGVPGFWMYGTDDITVLRVPFSIVSALTIPALYFLARQVVSPPAALIGSALLAMSRWHLNYARNAHNIFPTTFLVVVVLALCVRTYKRRGLRLYPWIGFWSAYTFYAYAGYRGTSILVAVFLLMMTAIDVRDWLRASTPVLRTAAKRRLLIHVAGTVLVALAMAGVFVVLGGRLHDNPAYFLEAANRSYQNKLYYTDDWGSWLWLRVLRQVDTLKIFHHWGDTEQAYNLPGEPMLDPITGVLFTAAVFYCLRFWRYRLQGYFVWAFLFLLFVGATITQTLVVCRLQGIVPLLFLLIAFLCDRLISVTGERLGRAGTAVIAVVAWGMCGAALYLNYDAYFVRTANNRVVRQVFRNFYTNGITYLHGMPDNGYLLFVSDMHNMFQLNDYTWWRGDRVPGSVTDDLVPLLEGRSGPWKGRELHLLIQEPYERDDLMELMQTAFPDASCKVIRHPENFEHLTQTACIFASQKPQAILRATMHANYFQGDGNQLLLERREPVVSWGTVPDVCESWGNRGAYECRVEWDGTFNVSEEGEYEVQAETRQSEINWTIDDRQPLFPMRLVPGEHRLQAKARFRGVNDIGVRIRWRRAGVGQWKLLRFEAPPAGQVRPSVDDPS